MTRFIFPGVAFLMAVSGISGWYLAGRAAAPRASSHTAALVNDSHPDRVQVFGDGTVAVSVNRVSLAWLMSEIARQGGSIPSRSSSVAPVASVIAVTPIPDSAEESSQSDPVDEKGILQTLRNGNELQRLGAVQELNSTDADITPAELQRILDSDPSDRVRLAALAVDLSAHEGDEQGVEALLTKSAENSSAAVRAESASRLEALREQRQAQAASQEP